MKLQLSDTSGIQGSLELAPPTRRLMTIKENGVVDKLFSLTNRPMNCKVLQKLYTRNMVTKSLIDITNTSKHSSHASTAPTKPNIPITNIVVNNSITTNQNEVSVARDNNEPSINDNQLQTTKDNLPMVDSFLDNDSSKRVDLTTENNITDQQRINDLDAEFDQFGAGPQSIFNPGDSANLDLLLGDEYPNQINIELTPTKAGAEVETKKDEQQASDEEEEAEGVESKKKTKSPSRKPRQSLKPRKSMNTTLKDAADIDPDDDADAIDETLSMDPTKNLNKRAKTMVSMLNKNFAKVDNVGFFDLIKRNGRKSVVQKFYSLLVLKKFEIIEVFQEETYGDIIINKGEKFDNFVHA
jgi:cohesin complex subunit SCC1